MKKNLFALLGIGLLFSGAVCAGAVTPISVRAEEEIVEVGEEETPIEEEKVGTVSVSTDIKYGSVTTDVVSGKVGDIITLTVKADFGYLVDSVCVNDYTLIKNNAGKYEFALVEGENIVTAKFVINEELLGQYADMFQSAKDGDWANVFTVENLVKVITALISGVSLIIALCKAIQLKRLTSTDIGKICSDIKTESKSNVTEITTDITTKIMAPMATQMANVQEAMSTFVQAFILFMMNDKSGAVALLGTIKIADQSVVNQAISYMEQIKAAAEKANEETQKALEEMKKFNSQAAMESEADSVINVSKAVD